MILILTHDASFVTHATLLPHFVTLLPFKRNRAGRGFPLAAIIIQLT